MKILNGCIQWLGTNIGSNFIRTYLDRKSEIGRLPEDQQEKAFEEALKNYLG